MSKAPPTRTAEPAALLERAAEELDRTYSLGKAGELTGERRLARVTSLWELRAQLETIPPGEPLDPAVDEAIDHCLDDLEACMDDLDLYDVLHAEPLADALVDGVPNAPTRAVGAALKDRVAAMVESVVPLREVLRAIEDVVDPDPATEDDDDERLADAEAIALDYLVHDWRWEEGHGVSARVRESLPNLSEAERAALDVMDHTIFDVYAVQDVDKEQGLLHLERVWDARTLRVGFDEDLANLLRAGDGLVARVYLWGDGPELGACLPVDGESLDLLRHWLEDLSDADLGHPRPLSRAARLKTHGHRIVTEILFPAPGDDLEGD